VELLEFRCSEILGKTRCLGMPELDVTRSCVLPPGRSDLDCEN
jgi:hypothetical protein